MKRVILLVMMAGTVLLTACSMADSKQPARVDVPTGANQPASTQPDPEGSKPQVEPTAPAQTQPSPNIAPQPAVRWYTPAIGHPLVSDDPASEGHKVVMLTLDDGPHPTYTPRVLDILKAQNVKAMFFITEAGMKNRALLERINREGHVLSVHSMTHKNLRNLPITEVRKEIEPLITLIQEVTGKRPKYFRPPYGAYNEQILTLLKEYRLELINWTDGSLDWEGVDANGYKEPAKVVEEVMRQLHPGAVILMHDTHLHSAEALPEIIRRIRAAGYEFVALQ